MKKLSKMFLAVACVAAAVIGLSACGLNQSTPENVAKAYINATKNLDVDALLNLYDTYEMTATQKDAVKARAKAMIEEFDQATKDSIKSVKFVKYEKVSGGDDNETGKITMKVTSEGEEKEIKAGFAFIKRGGKWFVKSADNGLDFFGN